VSCLGNPTPNGDFILKEIIYPSYPPSIPLSLNNPKKPLKPTEGDEWIAFVSGLECGDLEEKDDFRRELLIDWLRGEFGEDEVRETWMSDWLAHTNISLQERAEIQNISRLVILGDSMVQPKKIPAQPLDEPKKKFSVRLFFSYSVRTNIHMIIEKICFIKLFFNTSNHL
jgi:hypothetical protein